MTASSPVRVGVIGMGVMGSDHARILDGSISGAVVSAVSDVDPSRADSVAAGLRSAKVHSDSGALIADEAVDAVLIASSDPTHAELLLAAVDAGKPVLCEKPLAPTLREAQELVDALTDEQKALVSLGFMRRFDPGYVRMKADLRSGVIGAPLMLHCVSRGVSAGPDTTSEQSVTGSAIHELDVVPWLLESPLAEVAWVAPPRTSRATGLQDPQLLLLRTADGVLTTVDVFLNASYGYDVRCELVGENGTVELTPRYGISTSTQLRVSSDFAADWRPRFADAYRLQSQVWVDAILASASSPLATVGDGLAAARAAAAVITSMHGGGAWTDVDRGRKAEG